MGADFIQFRSLRGLPTVEQVERVHAAGLRINYCYVSDPAEIPVLFRLGVDFPMLNDVGAGVETARRLGIPPVVPASG